ncbi:amidohydrolase family protein [Bailinhaonella thermotolerans]|uniref:Amidohydrolase family protein n=1 Tax=Bailinhaonella thermotolerans TaxID=1070861 RepID=A0A3A4AP04_9ACTN|nr:amidohydrolase family protein [Bailinhaonella thermotolerans]RJL23068.1 amidohydrolase family protein [Bailinhaonella thermotolerans]
MRAIRAARLFDGLSAAADPLVLVEDGRITAVTSGGAAPEGAEVVDLGDVTLLPGLVDAHTHLAFDASADPVGSLAARAEAGPDAVLERMRRAARRALLAGVTTVRDLGDRDHLALRLAEETRADPAAGPRVLSAGAPITVPGGHCWYLGGEVSGPAAVRRAVRERAERGAGVIKVMASGGELTPGIPVHEPAFSPAELHAAVDEAHRLGLPITAHAHAAAGIAQVIDAGFDGVEHATFLTADGPVFDPWLVERLAASGVAASLTLGLAPGSPPPPPRIAALLPALEKGFADLHRAGVTLVVSSDAGINPAKPHDVLPHSIAHLAQITGASPRAAITAATATAARACGLSHRAGRIAPGLDADLLAVPGDPLRDLSVLATPAAVFRAGHRVV